MMEGSGEVVEWAVKMRRLPDEATLRAILDHGDVSHGLCEELGRRIAAFHARAERNERITELCRFENVARLARENLAESAGHVGSTVSARVFHRLAALTGKRPGGAAAGNREPGGSGPAVRQPRRSAARSYLPFPGPAPSGRHGDHR